MAVMIINKILVQNQVLYKEEFTTNLGNLAENPAVECFVSETSCPEMF